MHHAYLSTACMHGEHIQCRERCKFCREPCYCRCHFVGAPITPLITPTTKAETPDAKKGGR